MKIFDKRPLSLILTVLLGGFVIFSFFEGVTRAIFSGVALLLFILAAFLYKKRAKMALCISLAVAFTLGALYSFIYFDLWFKAYDRLDGKVSISATVIDYQKGDFGSTTYTLICDSIADESFSEYKILVTFDEDDCERLPVGTEIKFRATLDDFAYDSFDASTSYFSDGISARAINPENIEILGEGELPLSERISYLREYVRRYAVMLSDEESGSLLSALLFGERDDLSPTLSLAFRRIGISHVLALSGMHLSVISLALTKLLSLLRVRKKARTLIIIIFSIAYMAFTGFSVSVVRAGLMLIIASLLYLCSRTSDSITSLFMSVVIIILITPYAIYDVALWLSALATLGVILSGEYAKSLEKTDSKLKKAMRTTLFALLTTIFAIGATATVGAYAFGTFSLLTPITSIIFSFLAQIIMYVGSLMLLVGRLIPIKYLLSPIVSFTSGLAEYLSSLKYVYVSSTEVNMTLAITVFSLLFLLFTILDIKKPKIAISVIAFSYFLIYAMAGINIMSDINDEDIIYSSAERYDAFLLKSDGDRLLIESSQYSESTAYETLDLLCAEGVFVLEGYYATHYSWQLSKELDTLERSVIIKRLYLPRPENEDEVAMLENIKGTLSRFNTEMLYYNEDGVVKNGEMSVSSLYVSHYGEGESVYGLKIRDENTDYTYFSSGMIDKKFESVTEKEIITSDVLVFGAYGRKYSEEVYISDKYINKRKIILGSSDLFVTQATLQFYEKYGCEVYSHPHKISIYVK